MSEDKWLLDAMQKINDLTPDIKGKAFDPDWFLLREHLEKPVAEIAALRAALAERQAAIDELDAVEDARNAFTAADHKHYEDAARILCTRISKATAAIRALATKEPQPKGDGHAE